MALRKNPIQRVVPNETTAKRIFSAVFGEKKYMLRILQSKKVRDELENYSDEDDGECELDIAKAMVFVRIGEIIAEDMRQYPHGETIIDRISRAQSQLTSEMSAATISVPASFISHSLRVAIENHMNEQQRLNADLQRIKDERSRRMQSENTPPPLRVAPVSEVNKAVHHRLLHALVPLTFVVGSVLGGVSTADRFFSGKALAEGGEMKGLITDAEITDDGTPNTSRTSAVSAAIPLVEKLTPPPQTFDVDLETDAYVEEGGTYRVKLMRTPSGEVLLDKIKWVGKLPPPIDVKKCSPVNAAPVDTEIVGLECPYMGKTVTLAVEARDVDLGKAVDLQKWQDIPTRIKKERK